MIWAKGGPQQGALDPNAQSFGSQAIPACLLPSPPFDPSSGIGFAASCRFLFHFLAYDPVLLHQSEGKRHLHRLLTQGFGKRLFCSFVRSTPALVIAACRSSSSHVDSSSPSATLHAGFFCSFCTFSCCTFSSTFRSCIDCRSAW